MRKELIISTIPQETRVAVLEDDELVEFLVERHRAQGIAGNIYKGRVTKVLPGMQSAFVDIGLERDAFLYVSDFLEDMDEYDRIVSTAEEEAFKDGDSSRRVSSSRANRGPHPAGAPRPEKAKETVNEVPSEGIGIEKVSSGSVVPDAASAAREAAPSGVESPSPRPEPLRSDTKRSEAKKAKPETSETKRPDTRGTERPPSRRRPERRERKPRMPSYESRPQSSSPGTLSLLPGESLAKYKGKPAPAKDEANEPVVPKSEARSNDAAVGNSKRELSETGQVERPKGESPADGNTRIEETEQGEKRQARISGRPKDALFSRKPPARRPRRRTPEKSDTSRSDSSSKSPTISELLKEGQEILVQVSKEPLGKKGARITSHVALPGRYVVYMPTVDHIGVSRKIFSEDERSRLRKLIAENRDGLPGGFIVRTAAEGKDEKEFVQDLRFLADLWSEIREKNGSSSAPAVIHSDLNLVHRVLRDQLSDEFKAIRLDTEAEYTKVLEFVSRFQPLLVTRVRLHLKENAIFEEYGVQQEVDKAMRAKVWLKSGGYIVVNQTEALVAIDVNTGKFVGKSNRLEDTIVRTNMDAVHEIIRQVRLRNLGGIIVVDFIDMEQRKSRQRVMQALEEELQKDRSPSKILQFNDFGLVAITRKRTQPSLERIMGTSCPRCSGAGFVKGIETVCYEIQQEVRKMLGHAEGDELTLRVSPEVAKALKSGEFVDFTELEDESKKDIRIQGDPTLVSERFDIY
jgi:Rne/Rng family ribonuclease